MSAESDFLFRTADQLEREAMRCLRGWSGAHPCKPFDEVQKADTFFRVADRLRGMHMMALIEDATDDPA